MQSVTAVLLAVTLIACAGVARAAVPVFDWSVQGQANSNAFTEIFATPSVAVTLVETGYNENTDEYSYNLTAVDLATAAPVWSVMPDCNEYNMLKALPHADAPDAVAAVVCDSQIIGFSPRNGSVVWTITVGSSLSLTNQDGDGNTLPVIITPAGQTAFDRFIVTLYPQDGSSLTLLGVANPALGAIEAAEVPCLTQVDAVHRAAGTNNVAVVCYPGGDESGMWSLKGFTIANGHLDQLWTFEKEGLRLATAAGGTTLLALAYKLQSYEAAAGFTSFYSVDVATGAATELNVNQLAEVSPFMAGTHAPSVTWAGEQYFAFQSVNQLATAMVQGANLVFLSHAQYTNQQTGEFYQAVGIPSPINQYVVLQYNSNENVNLWVYCAKTGKIIEKIATGGETYGNSLQFDFCPTAKRVVVWGYETALGYAVKPDGNISVTFTLQQELNTISVMGLNAAVGSQDGSAFGFQNAPAAAWSVNLDYSDVANSVDGASFVVKQDAVVAYGSRGQLLWRTPLASQVDYVSGPYILGNYVAVFNAELLIALDQYTGRIAYTRSMQPSNGTAPSTCTGTYDATGATFTPGNPQSRAQKSIFVNGAGSQTPSQGGLPCSYVVRGDATVVTVPITSISTVMALANGDFLLLTATQLVRVDGWTGATMWTAPISYSDTDASLTLGANIVFVYHPTSYNEAVTSLYALSLATGAELWRSNTYQFQAAAGDDAFVYTTTGQSAIAVIETRTASNGTTYAAPRWTKPVNPEATVPTVYYADGVIMAFNGYNPQGETCDNQYSCLLGLDAATGDVLYFLPAGFGYCYNPTPQAIFDAKYVLLPCDVILAIDPHSAEVVFSAFSHGNTPLVSGDVLVQTTNTGVQAAVIPPAVLARVQARTAKPIPTNPPFTGRPSNVPAPDTLPPAPPLKIEPQTGLPGLAWAAAVAASDPSEYIAASTKAIDGMLLTATATVFSVVDSLTGEVKHTGRAPASCSSNDYNVPNVYTAGTGSSELFVVECGTLELIGVNLTAGIAWKRYIPGGASNTPPFVTKDGDVFVAAQANGVPAILIYPDGTRVDIALPNLNNDGNFKFARSDSHSFFVISNDIVATYDRAGVQVWNTTFDINIYTVVQGVSVGDDVVVVYGNDNYNCLALQATPDGPGWRTLIETSATEGSNTPSGYLVKGEGAVGGSLVYYASTATGNLFGLNAQTGKQVWTVPYTVSNYGQNADGSINAIGASPSCALFDGRTFVSGVSQYNVICLDPLSGTTKLNISYNANFDYDTNRMFGLEQEGTDYVLITTTGTMFNASLTTGAAEWFFESSNYDAQFARPYLIDAGTSVARVVVNDIAASAFVRCLYANGIPGSITLPIRGSDSGNANWLTFAVDGEDLVAIDDTTLYSVDSAGTVKWTAGLTGSAPSVRIFDVTPSTVLVFNGRIAVLRTDGIDIFTTAGAREARFTLDGLNQMCQPSRFQYIQGYIVDGRLIVSLSGCVYFFSSTLRVHAYQTSSSLSGAPWASGTVVLFPLQSGVIVALQPDGVFQYAVASRSSSSSGAAVSTAGSFVYSVNSQGEVAARLASNGELVWTAETKKYMEYTYGTPASPVVLNETAIVIAVSNGVVAVDARPETPPEQRLLWAAVDTSASSSSDPNRPLVSPYGVVVESTAYLLIAANATTGAVLWSTQRQCAQTQLAGRYLVARCEDVIAVDLLTGRVVSQLGTSLSVSGFVVVKQDSPDALPVVALGYSSPTTGDSVLQVAPLTGVPAAPAPSSPVPTMGPSTLPPNFTPSVVPPADKPGPYLYEMTLPHALVNYSWPTKAEMQQYSVATIGLSEEMLLVTVGGVLMIAYDPKTKNIAWQQALTEQCVNQNEYQFQLMFLSNGQIAYQCSGVVEFRDMATGLLEGVALVPNSFNLQSYQKGTAGFLCASFYDSTYNQQTGEYEYTYGVLCQSSATQWTANCSSTSGNNGPPFSAYNDVLMVSCLSGEVIFARGSDGEVQTRTKSGNSTSTVTFSDDGRYMVQIAETTFSQNQLSLFDAASMSLRSIYGVPSSEYTLTWLPPVAIGNTVMVMQYSYNNNSVAAYGLSVNAGLQGTSAPLLWWAVPFDEQVQNMPNYYYYQAQVTGNLLVVTCYIRAVVYTIGTWTEVAYIKGGYLSSSPTVSLLPAVNPKYLILGGSQSTAGIYAIDGTPLVTGPAMLLTNAALDTSTADPCIIIGTENSGFQCISPTPSGWARDVIATPEIGNVGPGTAVLGLSSNRLMVSTQYDLTALDPATGDVIFNRSLSQSNAIGYPVLAGDVAVSFTNIAEAWISSTATGDVIERVTIPLCGTVPSNGLASSAVVSGTNVFFTGAAGCLYHLSLTTRDVAVVDTTAGVNGSPLFATDGLLLWVTELNVLEAFDLAAQRRWAHELGAVRMFRRPQVYGNLVYVTSDIHTLHVLDKATGELVAVRSAFAVQLLGTLTAYNGEVWLPTTDSVVYFPADPKAAAAEPGVIPTVTVSSSNARSSLNTEPIVSATGVLVYATAGGSAAVDTMAKRFLWNTSEPINSNAASTLRKRNLVLVEGDTVVGGLSESITARDIRTGAIVRSWGISEPQIELGFVIGNGKVYYATYLNRVGGLDLGPVSRPPAASTSAAPNVADLATVPPATPAPDAAGAPSVGCVQRIATETAAFRACVSNTVIAPAYASRPAGSTFGCALAAQAMATCVSNYAALMPGCGQGVTFLQELVRGVNDSAAVPFCKRPATCASAAGSRDFCAALELPAWAKPSPIAGGPTLPPLPSYTTGAPSTAAPPTTTTTGTPVPTPPPTTTTTGTPVPTSQPPTNPPDTATVTGIPTGTTAVPVSTTTSAPVPTTPAPPSGEPNALSATQTLTLKPGADVPSAEELAAQLRVALRLGYTPSIVLLGLQNGDTVLFAFEGRDAAANAVKFERVPAARLSNDLHGTRAGPLEGGSAPAPSKSGLPTWGVAIIAVLGVIALVSVAVIVVKRNAVCGKQADLAGIESGPGSELASGRIRTGGEYQRFEDAV